MSAKDRVIGDVRLIADKLIGDVRLIADKPFVESVSDHFAGYFNELGITVSLAPDADDEEVIALQNQLLAYLDGYWEQEHPAFTWILMFSRGAEEMRSIFPGDQPRRTSEDLYWNV